MLPFYWLWHVLIPPTRLWLVNWCSTSGKQVPASDTPDLLHLNPWQNKDLDAWSSWCWCQIWQGRRIKRIKKTISLVVPHRFWSRPLLQERDIKSVEYSFNWGSKTELRTAENILFSNSFQRQKQNDPFTKSMVTFDDSTTICAPSQSFVYCRKYNRANLKRWHLWHALT